MPDKISFSINEEIATKLEELRQKTKKNKSQLFRDMVNYFYKNKDNLKSGLFIEGE